MNPLILALPHTMEIVETLHATPLDAPMTLIQKWLRAGVLEDGQWTLSEAGTPQGGLVSPVLANIYLHYAFDLWAHQWRKQKARGEVIIVRYADDVLVGFEHRTEAEQFREELAERQKKFDLELHAEKTRVIEFGRYAATNRKQRGEGKPDTFDFLGFTHICGTTRKGRFVVKWKTMRKRMRNKQKAIKKEMRRPDAHPGSAAGTMADSSAERAFPVLWSAIQQPCAVEISLPGEMALETDDEQTQPKRAGHLGTDGPASQEMVA